MPRIKFTYALKTFFPDLKEMELDAASLPELLEQVNRLHPGILEYLTDEQGSLRKHVNIFIDDELIRDKTKLSDDISRAKEIYILQALSGG